MAAEAASTGVWSHPLWIWLMVVFLLAQAGLLLALATVWLRHRIDEDARRRSSAEAMGLVRRILRGQQASAPRASRVLRLAFPIASVVRTSLSGPTNRAARDQLSAALRPALRTLIGPLTAESTSPWSRLTSRLGGHAKVERVLALVGALPDPEVLPQLLALSSSRRRRVACHATLTLGRGDERFTGATIPLATALREDNLPSRLVASWALKRLLMASPELVPHLIRDPEPRVRVLAVSASAAVLSTAPTGRADLVSAIHSALGDSDASVRAASCKALARLRDVQATSLLTRALFDSDREVQHEAARALAHIADPAAGAALVERLASADHELRGDIVAALAALKDAPSSQWIAQARSGNVPERKAALMALGTRTDVSLPLMLVDLLNDPELQVRRETALTIGAIARRCYPRVLPSQVAMRLLERMGREESRSTLAAITEALAFAGDHNTPNLLLQRISNSPAFLREQLLEAIAILELRR